MQKTLCLKCKHYLSDLKCLAFIDGIPDEIITGDNMHETPLPEQENNIVFEPKEEEKTKEE